VKTIPVKKDNITNSVIWKGTDDKNKPVSSGVYLYKISAGNTSATNKMLLLK
jgi:flagellar hook assembly protein FlgD